MEDGSKRKHARESGGIFGMMEKPKVLLNVGATGWSPAPGVPMAIPWHDLF
jgi:hypothetical protein